MISVGVSTFTRRRGASIRLACIWWEYRPLFHHRAAPIRVLSQSLAHALYKFLVSATTLRPPVLIAAIIDIARGSFCTAFTLIAGSTPQCLQTAGRMINSQRNALAEARYYCSWGALRRRSLGIACRPALGGLPEPDYHSGHICFSILRYRRGSAIWLRFVIDGRVWFLEASYRMVGLLVVAFIRHYIFIHFAYFP